VVFLLACVPYAATPWFGFVEYDDPDHVFENPMVVEGLTLDGVAWAFSVGADPAKDGYLNWPLAWLSHMADVSLFGLWAGGHHIVNVLLHATNAVLVLALGRGLGLGLPAALAIAAVFAVHPAQVESVAWVSERKTVLSMCFMLLSVLSYLRWQAASGGRHALGWLFAWNALGVLAVLAKPQAVTLPCVLLLLDFAPLGRVRGPTPAAWLAATARCVGEKLPLLACAGLDAAWTVVSQREMGAVESFPVAVRLAHAVVAYATYLRVFFWPVDLGCIHPHPGMPGVATFIAAAAVLLAMTAACIAAARRGRPLALVGWCWFLGTLVPMVGVVTVGLNGWSDRYLYLPIVGLAIAVFEVIAAIGGPAWAEWRAWLVRRGVSPTILGLVPTLGSAAWLAVLTAGAWHMTAQWRDTPTLAARTLAGSSEPIAHWYVWIWQASHHARLGEFGTGAEFAARAARVYPHHAGTWADLAQYQLSAGQATAALASASQALAADRMNKTARLTMAAAVVHVSDAVAARVWAELMDLGLSERDLALVFHTRGMAFLKAGRNAEAAIDFGIALDRDADHLWAATNLGVALTRLGRFAEAIAVLREAIERNSGNAAAWVGLGNALAQQGAAAEAVEAYSRALAIDPDDAATLVNRAWARLDAGDGAGARRDADAAAALGRPLDPDLLEAIGRINGAVTEPGS
jgi:tetratricopeptide (TPR) repeat protein